MERVRLRERRRERAVSIAAVGAIHAALGYALLVGLGFDPVEDAAGSLKLFDVAPEPPPPPAEPAEPPPEDAKRAIVKPRTAKPEGAASPANLRDTPTPVVAPAPIVRLPVPTPVIAAPVAAEGTRAAAGAADVPGPGTGSGGLGTGRGSGSQGDGTGGGGDGGDGASPARWIKGAIHDSDKPRAAYEARVGGTVLLRFVVAPTGRVSECAVTRSSGDAELDAVTCRMIKRRFRYRPARDGRGRAIPFVIRGEHIWDVAREPPGDGDDGDDGRTDDEDGR